MADLPIKPANTLSFAAEPGMLSLMSIESMMTEAADAVARSRATTDPDYPKFHVAPPVGRLNDPNGLIYLDGVYHAFFQFGPFHPERKAIYWGHATSTDLVNWEMHEPAIAPADWFNKNGVYSGGAIEADGKVWLHYTGNVKDDDGNRESYQCAVTTEDFTEFENLTANPLISGPPAGYTAHIRDPFVVGVPGDYTMYLGAQRDDLTGAIVAFRSPDLLEWTFDGDLTFDDPAYRNFGYMWECPNVVQMTDEVTGVQRDVLIFSPQGIDTVGDQFRNIFACGYLVGNLEGTKFTEAEPFRELDRGFEFYAPQVFTLVDESADAEPDRAPLLMGWVGNAAEDDLPSMENYGWVHALTAPRSLHLRDGKLFQQPELLGLDFVELAVAGSQIGSEDAASEEVVVTELTDERSFVLELVVEQAGPWEISLGNPAGKHATFRFDPATSSLTVDRSATYYPHGDTRTLAIPGNNPLDVTVVHDRSVTEVFVAGGAVAFTMRTFLDEADFQVILRGNGTVEDAKAAII